MLPIFVGTNIHAMRRNSYIFARQFYSAGGEWSNAQEGIEAIDYIAIEAMKAILTARPDESPRSLAESAYEIAEEMIRYSQIPVKESL